MEYKATFLLFYILPEFRRYSDVCNQQTDCLYCSVCTFTFVDLTTSISQLVITPCLGLLMKSFVSISEMVTAYVKFIGDNVEERKTVRDIRSDHHDTLHHMYSMLARAIPPPVCSTKSHTITCACFPSKPFRFEPCNL